jgi:hypothetical protein
MMVGLAKRLVDGELDVKDLYGARDVCMKQYKVALNFMWIPPGQRNLKTQQINWLRDRVHFYDIYGPKPYEFIGFGDIYGPKPYEFTGFGDMAPNPVNL